VLSGESAQALHWVYCNAKPRRYIKLFRYKSHQKIYEMIDLATLDRHLEQSQPNHLDQLKSLLRIPSISADPNSKAAMLTAAQRVRDALAAANFQTELIPTDGPPLVYAESPAVAGKPVALVYGHYDVQPPEPLAEWTTPPFDPQERGGNLYARGATDDKGQMLTHVLGAAAWAETGQALPMQVKFLIEGEEEVGSSQLATYLKSDDARRRLACDVIVISDSSQYAVGQPAITYGLRGIAYYQLHFLGPQHDLHSGSFGGAIHNPALALAKFLSKIVDDQGRIQLPGFYDRVKPLEESERKMWQCLNFSDAAFAQQLGVEALAGEAGFSTLERRWARPTYDIHGLWSGYQGEGGKTIIPASAGAKISFRLVPNQQPAQVTEQLRQFIADNTPPGIRIELIDLHGGPGIVVEPRSPFIAAAQNAVSEAFGKPAVLIREGGSIPIVAGMVERLGADVLLLGWGLDDDGAHSPNEKFCIADYYRGIRASGHLWHHLAEVS
jgi:acetylornithine deacetylase/succinyl-diaminopimelate desuccinylase-like protein